MNLQKIHQNYFTSTIPNINFNLTESATLNNIYLGKGGYGVVILSGDGKYVKKIISGEFESIKKSYLVKKVLLKKLSENEINKYFILPISFKKINFENLNNIIQTSSNSEKRKIINMINKNPNIYLENMLYFPNSLNLDLFIKNITLNQNDINFICRRLLLSLSYLHNNGIIHNDLKGENIIMAQDFFNTKNSLKNKWFPHLIDFGISFILDNPNNNAKKYFYGTFTMLRNKFYRPYDLNNLLRSILNVDELQTSDKTYMQYKIDNHLNFLRTIYSVLENTYENLKYMWEKCPKNKQNKLFKQILCFHELFILLIIIYKIVYFCSPLYLSNEFKTFIIQNLSLYGEGHIKNVNQVLQNFKKINSLYLLPNTK